MQFYTDKDIFDIFFIHSWLSEVSLYEHCDPSENLFKCLHPGLAFAAGISMLALACSLGSLCKRGHEELLAPSEGSLPDGSPSTMDSASI